MSPLLVGAALGATGVFMLDPDKGRRRRALVRDKVVHGITQGRDFADAAADDLRNRARGLAARARSLRGGAAADDVLCERVRSKLGRYCSHPGAIEVAALDGRVVLTGDILTREVEPLVEAVRSLRGVQHVDNQLELHAGAEHVSALQGGSPRHGEPWEVMEKTWTPGVRAVVGGAGAASMLYALARGGFGALVPLALGAALLACSINAATNGSMRRRG
jgi:hypothetical protein